ncbi:MAG: cupredoxin domain-containing protein [Candidatus Elarobacter sp.]
MRLSAILIASVVLASATVAASPAKPGPKALPVVSIVATAEQKFVPDHVVLHVGKAQTLRFTSTGGVHGVQSTDLGIPSTMIAPGKPVSLSVTPQKTGTYKIPCSIVCGPNHADMALTVEVKP